MVSQFSKDAIGIDPGDLTEGSKFRHVREIKGIGITEFTEPELEILEASAPFVTDLYIHFAVDRLRLDPEEYERRAAKLWGTVGKCEALEKLHVYVDRYEGQRKSTVGNESRDYGGDDDEYGGAVHGF